MKNKSRQVFVCIQFIKIGEINLLSDRYHAQFNVEARWIEESALLETYDPHTKWNPQIFVENVYQDINEQVAYTTMHLSDLNCTLVTEQRKLTGFFWERLEIYNFPVDLQGLSLVLASRLSLDEVSLIQDPEKPSSMNLNLANTFIDQQIW